MGIGSSNYTDPIYTVFPANSGYLYTGGGSSGQASDLIIGTSNTASDVVFFTGDTLAANVRARIKGTGNFLIGTDTDTGETFQVDGDAYISGATAFGSTVTLSADPTTALEAATKSYVDQQTTTGIHIHTPVRVATTANLTGTYAQGGTTFNITAITGSNTITTSVNHGLSVGNQIWLTTTGGNGLATNTAYFVYSTPALNTLTLSLTFGGAQIVGLTNATGLAYATRANSGVGATLTNSGTQVALTVDGVALSVADRVLVKNQSTAAYNGVYTVTTVGSGSTNWVLTRATDANQFIPTDPNGLGEGDYFYVQEGTQGQGDSFVLTTEGSIIIGYTGMTYTQFSGAITYTGGTNIDITGQVISVTGTIAATNGGTGTNTVTTGDLLYGSGTNTWSKLPLSTAYKSLVVNASGTQLEWNAVALNQAGAVSGQLGASNGGTGLSSLGTGVPAALGTNVGSTGAFVVQNGALGTPSSGTLTNATGLPISSGVSGLGTNVATALGVNVGTTGAVVVQNGALGTPSSGTLTNATGLPLSTGVTGTLPVANGGTGQTTYTDGQLLIGNSTGNTLTKATLTQGTGITITNSAGGITISNSTLGTVTSVGGTAPISSSGGTTPTISLDTAYGDTKNPYASKTANFFLAAPAGSAGAPTFRAVVATDIPTLNQNTSGTAANLSGSQTANYVYAAPNGSTGSASFRALVSADIPTLNQNTTGYAANLVGGNNTTLLGSVHYQSAANVTTQLAPNTTTNKRFLTQTGDGTNGAAPGWNAILAADVPTLNQNTSGSAATLTTSRSIHGGSFNGSADVTNIISGTYGGTNNGFMQFTGPTAGPRTFTLPDASATILTTNALVTAAQGGTNNGFTQFTGPTAGPRTFTLPDANATIVTQGGALGTPASGNVGSCTIDGTNPVGFRNIPILSQSAAYTTIITDAGKLVYHPSSDNVARAFLINNALAYPDGTAITFTNLAATASTIALTGGGTMYLAGSGATGTRTLAAFGVATAVKLEASIWTISGAGLT
jgi:hypothetical protein